MLSSYTIIDDGKNLFIQTAYCQAVVDQCRKWNGKYETHKEKEGWVVNASRLPEVQKQLGFNQDVQVEVEVTIEQLDGHQQLHVGWYVVASRRSRDLPASVFAELTDGEIPKSGGSVRNPAVNPSNDAKFRLWVPKDFAQARNLKVVQQDNQDERLLAVQQIKQLMATHNITTEELN